MTSHELARMLLARRDNDVRIRVLIDDDPTCETYRYQLVDLARDDTLLDSDLRAEPAVTYNPADDVVVINAGVICLLDPDVAADRDERKP